MKQTKIHSIASILVILLNVPLAYYTFYAFEGMNNPPYCGSTLTVPLILSHLFLLSAFFGLRKASKFCLVCNILGIIYCLFVLALMIPVSLYL